ncbi:hypothetical protein ACFX2I_025786 [Malus domestica]
MKQVKKEVAMNHAVRLPKLGREPSSPIHTTICWDSPFSSRAFSRGDLHHEMRSYSVFPEYSLNDSMVLKPEQVLRFEPNCQRVLVFL